MTAHWAPASVGRWEHATGVAARARQICKPVNESSTLLARAGRTNPEWDPLLWFWMPRELVLHVTDCVSAWIAARRSPLKDTFATTRRRFSITEVRDYYPLAERTRFVGGIVVQFATWSVTFFSNGLESGAGGSFFSGAAGNSKYFSALRVAVV
jgi:hypothetical protein